VKEPNTVLVTGGAGYVGAVLVPKLLAAGHKVKVLDLYLFGDDVLQAVADHPNLEQIKGDIRERSDLNKAVRGCDAIIHLACISNDPSFDLDPELGKTINYDAFFELLGAAKEHGVRRFVYASSSSVYGVKEEDNVTEDLPLEPLTDYSKYKALCEDALLDAQEPGFDVLILRPATVCGYSPRMRLDLAVNILTNHAVNRRRITVFGGSQKRPNIHIEDITDLYVDVLSRPAEQISGETFNVGCENHTISEIAEMVKQIVEEEMPGEGPVEVEATPTDDNRSYHVSSQRIADKLGFVPKRSVENAVREIVRAFRENQLPNSLEDSRYFNIDTMKMFTSD
jgi:nucleoside-diphosphate-sugar epimerase